MVALLVVLRLLHICSGVFWAGTAVYNAYFILPAAGALGPDGGKFMRQLAVTNQFAAVLGTVSTVTVVSGIALLTILSGGFSVEWMLTVHGTVLMAGATCALVAYAVGLIINRPTVAKMASLNQEIAKLGAPTDEHKLKIKQYTMTLTRSTSWMALLLIAAVVGMSLVRYI